jgi:DNA repair exonuclease SbcCD nuclease subunit
MKFAHMGDCHLGGWRQPELKEINFRSFQEAIRRCIKEEVDFVLIAGDLFDSAYPPIEILRDTFAELRKLKEVNIPVFLIAGSHDYSVSGKTFLDVLDKAGFCKNVSAFEEKGGSLLLQPTLFENVAIYGYPGKKAGLEVDEIAKIKLQDAPGFFKILMLHTTIKDAIGNMPIKAVNHETLPKVDYLALAHLHINYCKENRIYSGPIFPNNLSELEELQQGSFYIFDRGKIKKEEIKIKDVLVYYLEVNNALAATDEIISLLSSSNLKDKIVILKLSGILEKGKHSDIDFTKIEKVAREQGAFTLLKSTTKLHTQEMEIQDEIFDSANLESQIMSNFEKAHPSKYSAMVPELIKALQVDKLEDEKVAVFEERLLSDVGKIIQNEIG